LDGPEGDAELLGQNCARVSGGEDARGEGAGDTDAEGEQDGSGGEHRHSRAQGRDQLGKQPPGDPAEETGRSQDQLPGWLIGPGLEETARPRQGEHDGEEAGYTAEVAPHVAPIEVIQLSAQAPPGSTVTVVTPRRWKPARVCGVVLATPRSREVG
jgi:hypothetical protein